MKKIIKAMLACLLLVSVLLPLLAFAETWYCPLCGYQCDGNFCPKDGTKNPLADAQEERHEYSSTNSYPDEAENEKYMMLNELQWAHFISTNVKSAGNDGVGLRSGPGVQYPEGVNGIMRLPKGEPIKLISIYYDSVNEINWLQIEFSMNGQMYRAYSGIGATMKEIWTRLNYERVPWTRDTYQTFISRGCDKRYGPGVSYARVNDQRISDDGFFDVIMTEHN